MFLQSSNLYFWCSFLTICKGVQRRTTLSRHSGFLEDTWIRHKKVAPRDTLLETRILLSVAHILIDIKFNFLNFMYNLLQQFESFSFFYFSVLINIDEKIFFFFFQKLEFEISFDFSPFQLIRKYEHVCTNSLSSQRQRRTFIMHVYPLVQYTASQLEGPFKDSQKTRMRIKNKE